MKQRLIKGLGLAAACGILGGLLSGCAWSIGDCKERPVAGQPTRGQELIDLKKAKDQGAISEEEYDNQKQQILNR